MHIILKNYMHHYSQNLKHFFDYHTFLLVVFQNYSLFKFRYAVCFFNLLMWAITLIFHVWYIGVYGMIHNFDFHFIQLPIHNIRYMDKVYLETMLAAHWHH